MMHEIIKMIKNNFLLKIFSVVIAVFIWLLVVNISNPEITETVTCNLDVYYGEELSGIGKTYTLSTDTVRISYKIRSNFRRMVYPSSFKPYVDLRDYSVTGAVPVYVDVDDSIMGYISEVTQNPMVVHVETENMIEKAFDIGIEPVGQPAVGKIVGPVELSSEQVVLYGPENDIGRIARAAIVINVDGASADLSGTGVISFYDSNNNEIKLDPKTLVRNEINYKLAIYGTKVLYLNAQVNGTPARGYAVNSIEVSPTSVEVYGRQDVLDMYTSINLPKALVDVSGATRNVAVSTNVSEYMPEGVNLSADGNVTIVAFIGYTSENNVAPTAPANSSETGGSIGMPTAPEETDLTSSSPESIDETPITPIDSGESVTEAENESDSTESGQSANPTGTAAQPTYESPFEVIVDPSETENDLEGFITY